MPADSQLCIVEVLPELLGTYGDAGNATVLCERLVRRGFPVQRLRIPYGTSVPDSGDIYLLGGGEGAAQTLAADQLHGDRGMRRVIDVGRPVLAVCAGLQILGRTFVDGQGALRAGLGLLDLATTAGRSRAIGEVVSRPAHLGLAQRLTGFENHLGRTELGGSGSPLGWVVRGTGNGDAGGEGVVSGHVVGTYLHGPALVRNPELADLLLGWAVGGPLPELPMASVDRLRASRLRSGPRTAIRSRFRRARTPPPATAW